MQEREPTVLRRVAGMSTPELVVLWLGLTIVLSPELAVLLYITDRTPATPWHYVVWGAIQAMVVAWIGVTLLRRKALRVQETQQDAGQEGGA